MKPQYIRRFEKLGLGLFIHYGLYSVLQKGEWHFNTLKSEEEKQRYFSLINRFKTSNNWAKDIVRVAKKMGAKYIVLTTRHHDGFSLYDTKGLSDFDVMHSSIKRDLVKEFVDECNKNDIVPFFYHTLLDWHNKDFDSDFPKYIDYLIKSIELLCKNYGNIGGFWFDGSWSKQNENWQFDRLYKMIRKYQPEAMIINNTGLDDRGVVGHYEIDSVTYERGLPNKVPSLDDKERAGEVCESLTDHWGSSELDIHYKDIQSLINLLLDCRYHECNLIINGGVNKNGTFRKMDESVLSNLGIWVHMHEHIIHHCKPSDIQAENALIFKDDHYYYAVIKNVPLMATLNVVEAKSLPLVVIKTDKKIVDACCYDSKKTRIKIDNKNKSFPIPAFPYGMSLCARVVRFKLK